jgi:hypothetical protein
MAAGERIARDVSGPLLALARGAALAAAVFAYAAPARADCFSDIVNAVVNTASALDSPQCQTAFAESSLVTSGLTAALTADPNLANQVCNAISDVNSWLPAIPAAIQSELGPLNPIDFATCACSMYQGVGQLPSEAVQCVQDLICGISQLVGLGNPCQTCQQPPPLPANCTPPAQCYNLENDPSLYQTCKDVLRYNTDGPNDGYFPVQEQQEPDGSTIIITGLSTGSLHTCSPGQYCVCPSPMTVVNVKEYDPSGNSHWWYATCACPTTADRHNDPTQGTHALQPSGPLAYVCVCDSTGLPAVPPDWGKSNGPNGNDLNPTRSICPTPLTGVPCPVAGQIRVGGNKCVAPCTKPGEVMTPDGTCCDPNNVAACGQCCPNGLVANPATGTCTQEQVAQ